MFDPSASPTSSVRRPQRTSAQPSEPATDPSVAEDHQLVSELLREDPKAWRTFNQRYARLMYGCITRVTSRFSRLVTQDDVNEIYATLCLQLIANDKHKLRCFEPERGNRLGTWLGLLAVRAAYDYLRTLRRRPSVCQLGEVLEQADGTASAFDQLLERERAGLAASALDGLSDKDREFITLYYGEGLEPTDVAERMGISVKTVYSKKHKIMARLEALLQKQLIAA